jgi:hypothetical protein
MILRSVAVLMATAMHQAEAKPYIGTYGAHDDAPVVPLVTGCGRAGTHTAGELLLSLGVKAVHEGAAGDAVAVSWFYGTDQSFEDVDTVRAPQWPSSRRRKGSIDSGGVFFWCNFTCVKTTNHACVASLALNTLRLSIR